MRGVEIIHAQEEADPAGDRTTDHGGLVLAIGARESIRTAEILKRCRRSRSLKHEAGVGYDAAVLISLRVPYDEARLRRSLRFILHRQVLTLRVMGALLLLLGVVLVGFQLSQALAYVAILLGLWWLVGAGPAAISRALRAHRRVLGADSTVTLDDEWITVSFPNVDLRQRWIAVDRVAEGPEAWYVMVAPLQAITIPKDRMTPEQRAEFSRFVANLRIEKHGSDQSAAVADSDPGDSA